MNRELLQLHKSWKTVFGSDDLANYYGVSFEKIKQKIAYSAKKGDLLRIYRGIYVLDKNYNILELANKILKPSYISLDTVLRKEGIIFQYSEKIKIISHKTMRIEVDGHSIDSHFLKENIRNNLSGVEYKNNFWIATKERAFLDSIYLYKDVYFDNLRPIDWAACFKLVKIYHSPILEKRLTSYYQTYAQHYSA